jgi:NAD(P)-dependent dehydrogenase (short-subunit alcohol dehydrogenase family)
MAAELLLEQGHAVVLHARNEQRVEETQRRVPKAEAVLKGDLSKMRETLELAENANRSGRFDAVILNAAVGYRELVRKETADGLSHVFAINSLAPYILTCALLRPNRLVYLSSGLHLNGDPSLRDLQWKSRRWNGVQAYSDSKLHNVLLAFAMARRFPTVLCNAVTPGWVPTKMGGPEAPDDLAQAHLTQAWLATSEDTKARTSGRYFYHLEPMEPLAETKQSDLQESFIAVCQRLSGIALLPE